MERRLASQVIIDRLTGGRGLASCRRLRRQPGRDHDDDAGLVHTRARSGLDSSELGLTSPSANGGAGELHMLAPDYTSDKHRAESQIDEKTPIDGRRVYIHSYSLRCLGRQSADLASQITSLLAEVRAAKIVHHHIVDLGVGLGLVRKPIADQFFQSEWREKLSEFFQTLGYRPCFPSDKSLFLRLIEQDEQIVASCSDSGYYTFATGTDASDRMFADNESIPKMQRSLNRGEGPPDLTIIRGNSLALIDGALGTGKVGYRVRRSLAITEAELDVMDEVARASFIEMFQARIASVIHQLTMDEQQVCGDAFRSMQRSFERVGSLSL